MPQILSEWHSDDGLVTWKRIAPEDVAKCDWLDPRAPSWWFEYTGPHEAGKVWEAFDKYCRCRSDNRRPYIPTLKAPQLVYEEIDRTWDRYAYELTNKSPLTDKGEVNRPGFAKRIGNRLDTRGRIMLLSNMYYDQKPIYYYEGKIYGKGVPALLGVEEVMQRPEGLVRRCLHAVKMP